LRPKLKRWLLRRDQRSERERLETLFAGYKEIPGSFLYPEFVHGAAEAVRECMARDLGCFLRGVHSVRVADALAAGARQHSSDPAQLASCQALLIENARSVLRQDEADRLIRFLETAGQGTEDLSGSRLLHGDFNWDHILCDPKEGKITGIIDFGGMYIGDPVHDFIPLWLKYGDAFASEVLRHYGCRDTTRALRKAKFLHCCETAAEIRRGLDEQDPSTCERGWRLVRESIASLS
jgi:aminoglycoside phosphotransferase (APT) family kinase protein